MVVKKEVKEGGKTKLLLKCLCKRVAGTGNKTMKILFVLKFILLYIF